MKVEVEVSARHIHLDVETKKILFPNIELTKKCDLSQKGQYACNETLTIINGDKCINNVRILGPLREKNQVEISKSDAFNLKINAPIRNSGDLEGADKIILKSEFAEVTVDNAVIIAARHIHVDKNTSEIYNLKDGDLVKIKIDGDRGGVLDNVLIRISDMYTFKCHLDTDEANAFNITSGDLVEIIK